MITRFNKAIIENDYVKKSRKTAQIRIMPMQPESRRTFSRVQSVKKRTAHF